MEKKTVKIYQILVFFLLFFGFSSLAHAATISVVPAVGDFETGERVAVKVVATSNNASFNAVSSIISFPTSIFSIESVSKTNSVLNFWVTEPFISRGAGTVKFEGVALNGFTGGSGTVLTVNLRAVKAGTGKVSFQSGQILANDGEGTDITGNLIGAIFNVIDAVPKIKQPKLDPPESFMPEAIQPVPSLEAPEIMLGQRYGAQAILGSSKYPKAQALVTFLSKDGVKIFIIGLSDDDGGFDLLVPSSLKRGYYTVSAVMIKEDKINSEISNTITVKVGNFLQDIPWEISLLLFLLILLIVYLILRVHYHFHKRNSGGYATKSELQDTESIVHKSFGILREDIMDHNKDRPAVLERKYMSGLTKDINDAEKIITKKIRDIE